MLQQVAHTFRALWALILTAFTLFKKGRPASKARFELPVVACDVPPPNVNHIGAAVPGILPPLPVAGVAKQARAMRAEADLFTGGPFNAFDVATVLWIRTDIVVAHRAKQESTVPERPQLGANQEEADKDERCEQTSVGRDGALGPMPTVSSYSATKQEVKEYHSKSDDETDSSSEVLNDQDLILESSTLQTEQWKNLLKKCEIQFKEDHEEEQSNALWTFAIERSTGKRPQHSKAMAATFAPSTEDDLSTASHCVTQPSKFDIDGVHSVEMVEGVVVGEYKSGHCPSIIASSPSPSECSSDDSPILTPSDSMRFKGFRFPMVASSDLNGPLEGPSPIVSYDCDPFGNPFDTAADFHVDAYYGDEDEANISCSPSQIAAFSFANRLVDDDNFFGPSDYDDEPIHYDYSSRDSPATTAREVRTADLLFQEDKSVSEFDSLFVDPADVSLPWDICKHFNPPSGTPSRAPGSLTTSSDDSFIGKASTTEASESGRHRSPPLLPDQWVTFGKAPLRNGSKWPSLHDMV